MLNVKGAIARVKQRSKLPTGDHIVRRLCVSCQTTLLLWNDDPRLTGTYPYRVLCSYCTSKEKAERAAIWGKR